MFWDWCAGGWGGGWVGLSLACGPGPELGVEDAIVSKEEPEEGARGLSAGVAPANRLESGPAVRKSA